jgi:hypothetical protein
MPRLSVCADAQKVDRTKLAQSEVRNGRKGRKKSNFRLSSSLPMLFCGNFFCIYICNTEYSHVVILQVCKFALARNIFSRPGTKEKEQVWKSLELHIPAQLNILPRFVLFITQIVVTN